jgi:hypothetical protein
MIQQPVASHLTVLFLGEDWTNAGGFGSVFSIGNRRAMEVGVQS